VAARLPVSVAFVFDSLYSQCADPTKVTIWGSHMSHAQNSDKTSRGTDHGLQERLPLDAKEDHKLGRIDIIASLYYNEAMVSILPNLWQSVMSTMVDTQQHCFHRSTWVVR
jgi:hypothetical protein